MDLCIMLCLALRLLPSPIGHVMRIVLPVVVGLMVLVAAALLDGQLVGLPARFGLMLGLSALYTAAIWGLAFTPQERYFVLTLKQRIRN